VDEHPYLPAGANSTALCGDDINGAGVNHGVHLFTLLDSADPKKPVVLTHELQDNFANTKPTFRAPGVNNTIRIPYERNTIRMR
jgi:hypothetical protein